MVFDVESKDQFVIYNPSEHLALYRGVNIRTMEAFQSLDIDCRNIQFAISDSTRKDKFSIHIVSNYYFETWDIQCQFMKKFTVNLLRTKRLMETSTSRKEEEL